MDLMGLMEFIMIGVLVHVMKTTYGNMGAMCYGTFVIELLN